MNEKNATSERFYPYWNDLPIWRKAWAHIAYRLCMILPVRSRLFYILMGAAGDLAYRDDID